MPHFMQLVDNRFLGAINFTDGDMRPTEVTLTIKSIAKEKPPQGKAEKPCLRFEETPKGWFISTGQMKKLANYLMIADYTRWTGCKVTLTCGPVKAVTGGETMGIIIVAAERPAKQQVANGDNPPQAS